MQQKRATLWSGLTTPGPPTCSTGAPDATTHCDRTFEAGGLPIRTTISGTWSRAKSV